MSLRNSLRQSVISFSEKCCTVAGYRGCNNATNQPKTATPPATTHATTPLKPSNSVVIGATPPATTLQQALKNRATTVQQTTHIPEPDKTEKLHQLSFLIKYIAANEGFSKSDVAEAKWLANKDIDNALISFRALARDIRKDRAIEQLRANPEESLRAVHIDADSDPNNVILAIAVRNVAVAEMKIPRSKYNPWRLMNVLDEEVH